MANELVSQLYEFIFQKMMLGVPSGYTTYNPTDAELSVLFGDIVDVDVSTKMDLVPAATVANFAAFDADGQVYDSLKNAGSFAPLSHNHDTRYLRLDAANTYNATALTGNRFTWQVLDEAPFDIDNVSGDILDVVTHFNADLLDGKHAGEFAKQDHSHSIYAQHAGNHTITGTFTFDRTGTGVAPFAVAADNNGMVANLNADLLDGVQGAGYALAAHTHGDIYYTETEIDALLAAKLDVPANSTTDPTAQMTGYIDDELKTTNITLGDIATVTQIALKYDEIAGVNGNLVAFATSGTTLADSGSAPSDFAAASHDHNSIYFTETELTNNTIGLALASLDLDDDTAAGAGAGTLSNAPTAGNPTKWFVISNGGTSYAVPGWPIP